VRVPVREHPVSFAIPKLRQARALLGLPEFISHGQTTDIWTYYDKDAVTKLQAKHKAKEGKIRIAAVQPLQFFRMIAKIAHSFAVAEFGVGKFKPLVTDLILGRSDNIEHFLGGQFVDIPATPNLHELK